VPALAQTTQEDFDAGQAALRAGDYAEAITLLTQVIDDEPAFAPAYNARGQAHEALEDYSAAIADYTQAIELEPSSVDYLNDRARAHFFLQNYTEAIGDYSLILQLAPDDAITYNRRGFAYFLIGSLEQAVEDFSAAVEADPELAWAYNNRAIVYRTQGDLDSAISDHTRAVEIDSQYWWGYESRAQTYAQQGRNDLAIADLTRIIQAEQASMSVFLGRAQLYLETDQPDEALLDFAVYTTRQSLEFDDADFPAPDEPLTLEIVNNLAYRLPVEIPASAGIRVQLAPVAGGITPLALVLDADDNPLALSISADDGGATIADYFVEEAGTYSVLVTHAGPMNRAEVEVTGLLLNPDGSQLCTVTVSGTQAVNRRSGPSTAANVAGVLNPGENAPVIGQAEGGDGFTWYQLEESAWVRADVISASGDCEAVPAVTP
ncbi:MAG: tetratricopeptide repeat protein, partial [Phototrophicaceae bacterium]